MEIGICDDEAIIAEGLKCLIEKCIKEEEKEECHIRCFCSGGELLNHISELDMVFLDIVMPEIDGIEIGNKIKEINPHCKVVMETAYTERFKESFKFGAFRFITKPFDREEVWEALDAALSLQIGMGQIELYQNRNKYSIPQRDIQYIMAYDGYTEFYVKNQRYRKEVTLKRLEESLDRRIFFQINRTYIINMLWIEDIKNGVVKVGDKKIPVSRRSKKAFERAYMEFDINYG